MTIDLAKMKRVLEAKREELRADIARLMTPPDLVEPLPQDSEDSATDLQVYRQEQSILENEQALLAEVEAALTRIEEGSYGLCATCGRPIPEKRLEAIPWAARDVQCESQRQARRADLFG
jgi:DnaK suppressor protein